jgi:hypothetical protein
MAVMANLDLGPVAVFHENFLPRPLHSFADPTLFEMRRECHAPDTP